MFVCLCAGLFIFCLVASCVGLSNLRDFVYYCYHSPHESRDRNPRRVTLNQSRTWRWIIRLRRRMSDRRGRIAVYWNLNLFDLCSYYGKSTTVLTSLVGMRVRTYVSVRAGRVKADVHARCG